MAAPGRFAPRSIRTHLLPCTPERWTGVAAHWERLARVEADVPFFMGRDWVETWLDVFGPELSPRLFACEAGGDWLGACLLTERREQRGPIPVRCLYLHTAGEAPGEGVCVEYHELLSRIGAEEEVVRALASALRAGGADELCANGLTEEALERLRRAVPGWLEETTWSSDPFVDLEQVRKSGGDYRRRVLSGNARAQLGRSLRAYEAIGGLELEVARETVSARAMLEELIALHQATWTARGRGGAFASARNRAFHERLIERCFESGAIQLLRLRTPDETVGLLYCFVDDGRVYFYQSGFRYRDEARFRPGIVTHVLAIELFLALDLREYHFLAGDATTPRYKASLSNVERRLAWSRFQRPGAKTALVRGLRAVKRRWETRP